jgi:hypothetical protein
MLPTLRGQRSARAAWDTIKTIRVGVERVRESKAQQLRRPRLDAGEIGTFFMKSPLRAQLFGYVGTKMPKI